MKRTKRVAVVLLSGLQLAAPTLARGDDPRAEVLPRLEVRRTELSRTPLPAGPNVADTVSVERPREKTLSLSEFTDAFHNPKITYNDVTGEVSFSGTTAESCMDRFSFSREASTEIKVTFRYLSDSDKNHCLDKDQIKCEKEQCAGLRTKEDSKIKLGKESGDIRIVYTDLYNLDELASNPIAKDGKNIYHKGEAEIAKEKLEAAEKAKTQKIEESLKALNACCTKTEQGFEEKRGLIAELAAIEAFTSEDREKYEQKVDLEEMDRITAEIKKARIGAAEGEESELELLKERLSALMDKGDPAVIKKGKTALAAIIGRKLKDVTVDPATAAGNALAEIEEFKNSGFEFNDAELLDLQNTQNAIAQRQYCLTAAFNSMGCRQVIQGVIKERTVAVPQIDANGKILSPEAAALFGNAVTNAQGTQAAAADLQNVSAAKRIAIPSNQSIFGQFGVPQGFPQFTPDSTQSSMFGIVNSGYQQHHAAPQNIMAPSIQPGL